MLDFGMEDPTGDDVDVIDEAFDDEEYDNSLPWTDYESPSAWVLSIIVGAIFGLIGAVLDGLILAGSEVESAFANIGATIYGAGSDVSTPLLNLLETPFGVISTIATATGPFAPLMVAVVWFAAGALFIGILMGIWRFLQWL